MSLRAEHIKALAVDSPGGGTRDMTVVAAQLAMASAEPQHQLPISEAQFLSGGFNPALPAPPSALDPAIRDAVLPRRQQYPVGYNLPSPPGATKLIDFRSLRNLADVYDVLRRCLEIRKQEIAQIDWEITNKEPEGEVNKDDLKALTAFFEKPDPIRGWHWDDWVKAALEEVFVVDALSIYPHLTWGKGRGPLGSELFALEILDGATIKPLVDVRGSRPQPPNPAYQQFLYGIPRTELAADVAYFTQDSNRPMGAGQEPVLAPKFMASELYYRPYHPRTWTLYGFSNVEQIIININLALKRQQWHTSYFTDGSVPALLLHAPEDWDAKEIREYEETWNSMVASDIGWKHKAKVVPGIKGVDQLKPVVHDMSFDEWVARITCFGCDVMPMEVGLEPKGVIGGNGQAEAEERATYRKSLRPILSWFEIFLTELIGVRFNRPDYRFRFIFGEAEDRLKRAQEDQLLIDAGVKTQDEARIERGLDPYPDRIGARPILVTRMGPSRLEDIDAISKRAAGLNPDGSPAEPSGTVDLSRDPNAHLNAPQIVPGEKAAFDDLRRWETKSLRAVRDGRSAAVRFHSDALTEEESESIHGRLLKAASVDDVRSVFRGRRSSTAEGA